MRTCPGSSAHLDMGQAAGTSGDFPGELDGDFMELIRFQYDKDAALR